MKELINAIETNYDLFDFLHYQYINDKKVLNENLKIYYPAFVYDKMYIKDNRSKIDWYKVSLHASLSEEEIDEYFEELRECRILVQYGPAVECLFSQNINIKWNDNLLEKYKEYLYWPSICKNPAVPWNEYLIDKYIVTYSNNLSNWISLSSNEGIEWNESLIAKYYPNILLNSIIKYSKIFWSKSLLNSTLKIIKEEDRKLYLTYFSEITNIEWDIETILDFPISYSYWVRNIIKNKTISLTFDIVRKYINRIDKTLFEILQVSDDLIWDIEKIIEFREYINFKILSQSQNVNWSEKLVETFENNLDFDLLSENRSVSITENLISKYKSRWNFKFLSSNKSAKWNLQLIEEFVEFLILDKIIENDNIEFTPAFIEKHKLKISWKGNWRKFGSDGSIYKASIISQQKQIPINVSTLSEMATKWEKGNDSVVLGDIFEDIGEWQFYSQNIYITKSHLEEFTDKLNWRILSQNIHLKISKDILLQFREKWDYTFLFKRNDIDWDLETFCKIVHNLNWDILKDNEIKIYEILKEGENSILNYFTFKVNYTSPLHSESWQNFAFKREFEEKKEIYLNNLASDSLNELKNMNFENRNDMWKWLKRYSTLYYENSKLNDSNTREPIYYDGIIRSFIYEYQRVKAKHDVKYKNDNTLPLL